MLGEGCFPAIAGGVPETMGEASVGGRGQSSSGARGSVFRFPFPFPSRVGGLAFIT